ncbi:hypothetical protein [Planobispora longispora]|uniref:Uncharacterized protein n=1 Tax=Planobispora longispora TaxID=28887 RepID=A0A8J3RNG8_9ACTN|nr:hypothetical protein [Planobispora longispora]BFE79423.1 hypothetical protein GCM10020093_020240 [Planobispora longispora]GIH78240.1 hypothetical protein Plo01_46690 [Planobispora longispora]
MADSDGAGHRVRPVWLLGGTAGALLAGIVLHALGAVAAGDAVWAAGTVLATVPAVRWVVAGLRAGRLGVDAIAVLALMGALAVREHLAGAVIAVMPATGRVLEDYALRRAHCGMRKPRANLFVIYKVKQLSI